MSVSVVKLKLNFLDKIDRFIDHFRRVKHWHATSGDPEEDWRITHLDYSKLWEDEKQ